MAEPDRPPQITIVTVVIEKHYAYVAEQLSLIGALNPGADWKLLVVDNAAVDAPLLSVDDPRCEVIAGVAADASLPDNFRGSYHHAAALNYAIAQVKTRYVVVLDPDLFVVYRDWMGELVQHTQRHSQSFFGVPWHYRWYNKYRYYPCAHFLLIDLHRVAAAQLDFTPAIADERPESTIASLFKQWPLVHIRWRLNSSRDTGWRLWHHFRRTGHHPAGLALPVVDVDQELQKPAYLKTAWGRWLERRLPRRLSVLPAPGTYVEPRQAPGFQSPAMAFLAPEMFVWRGAPFAFHLRRHVRDTVHKNADQVSEDAVLGPLLRDVQGARLWVSWAFQKSPPAAG